MRQVRLGVFCAIAFAAFYPLIASALGEPVTLQDTWARAAVWGATWILIGWLQERAVRR